MDAKSAGAKRVEVLALLVDLSESPPSMNYCGELVACYD
jgi:hypothetical protein